MSGEAGDDTSVERNERDRDEPLSELTKRIREKREQERTERHDGTADGSEHDSDSDGKEVDSGDDTFVDEEGREGPSVGGMDDDSLFEEMDVGDVDTDAVWESVLTDEEDVAGESSSSQDPIIDADVDVERNDSGGYLVPKRDYCETCEFFSDPPTVACHYDGAEIVELVDSERFRVRNCPVVAGHVGTDGSIIDGGDTGLGDDSE